MNENSITVLLIEDNPFDARLIRELLEEETSPRFELAHTTDLEAGLDRLAQGGVDVALVDLSLPDSQGIETFNRVHAHSPHVPIVVLTGLKDEAVAAKTLHSGGQDFLNKGALNLCVLQQTLRHAMDRKQTEVADVARHLVEAANRDHDKSLAVLCAELRTQLTTLHSSLSLLTDRSTKDSELLPAVDMMRSCVEQHGRLIDAVMTYSRVRDLCEAFRTTDCEAVLEQALANLQPLLAETSAVVTHNRLPSVWADRAQMGQLFQYLIANAIKYRGDAPPRIHISAERHDAEWVFSVRDSGIGFDPEHSDQLFIIFHRMHEKDEFPGTGIGLAICKTIVERHAGRIWAESEAGWGARFSFSIPASADGAR